VFWRKGDIGRRLLRGLTTTQWRPPKRIGTFSEQAVSRAGAMRGRPLTSVRISETLGVTTADPAGETVGDGVQSGGDRTEAGPGIGSRCPACGETVAIEDEYCTRCGAPRTDRDQAQTAIVPPSAGTARSKPAPVPGSRAATDPASASVRHRLRSNRLAVAAAFVIVLLVAALAFAAIAWQRQRSAHHRVTSELQLARSKIRSLQSQVATTKAKLTRIEALSTRQQTILRRTGVVLGKVDPLLSGADELRQLTGEIKIARDAFEADSQQAMSDAIVLENYEADPQNYPGVDEAALVDRVNSELETMRADAASLSSSDSSYDAASQRFGVNATSFTDSVRALQRELRGLKTK